MHPAITPRFCHCLRSLWNVSVTCARCSRNFENFNYKECGHYHCPDNVIRLGLNILFYFIPISKTLRFSKPNYKAIKLVMSTFKNDICGWSRCVCVCVCGFERYIVVYLALLYYALCRFAATLNNSILRHYYSVTIASLVYESDYEKLNYNGNENISL